jgi:hypothetical protein
MAIEYWFEMVSDLNREQARRLLAEHLSAELTEEGYVYKSDILVTASDLHPGRSTEVTEEAFHFTPSLGIGFRRQYEADALEFSLFMLRGTMLLLEHGRDAVLLFNHEIIVFQRLGGQLVFNTDFKLWDEELLKEEVRIPYERRSLPSPLL